MLSIASATEDAEFAIAGEFARLFGEWDARQCEPLGFSREEVISAFHRDNANTLASKFRPPDASLLLTRWNEQPAGMVAFNIFNDTAYEMHKFYVSPEFRGKGIGSSLVEAVLAGVSGKARRTLVLHTTTYMTDAISIYEKFGFRPCERFRDTPEHLSVTDHFMSRAI